MKVYKKVGFTAMSFLLMVLFSAITGYADTFPSKPITMIVPSKPGGAFDSQARAIASVAQKYFGVPVVIENVPGAAFTIGATKVAKSKPDGYTLHSSSESPFTSSPLTLKVDFDPRKDLVYICSTGVNYQVVAVNSKLPYKTIGQLFSYVKQHPQELTVSYSSVLQEFWLYRLMDIGHEFTPVVFPSGAEAAVACGGGHTNINMGSLAAAKGLIESSDMRALLYSPCSKTEPPLKGVEGDCKLDPELLRCFFTSRVGVQGPKGIPADRLKFLEEKLFQIYNDKDFQAMMIKMGFGLDWLGTEENTKHYMETLDEFEKVLKKHNLKRK